MSTTTPEPATEPDLYRHAADTMADTAQAGALALLGAWLAGKLTDTGWKVAMAGLLVRVDAGAVTLADLLAARRLRSAGLDVFPIGMGLPDDGSEAARLTKAVETLGDALDDPDALKPRVVRIARAEPLRHLQLASLSAYTEHGVPGWVRGLDADPCQLCTWWWREGRVWPMTHRMPQHPGCTCQPVPVLNPGPIKPVQTKRGNRP
ncbi:MAG TPA: hypothetical protein VFJ19_05645 [Nocardioidaceae bacterium]|nr:hypothetical protein [Nocardioidaceae bacterium]